MPVVELTPDKLVLTSSGTTLRLDGNQGRGILQRKVLFWSLKPAEAPLSDMVDAKVEGAVDRASGVEIFSTTILMRSGFAWLFPAADKVEAETNTAAIRRFLGLTGAAPSEA